MVNISLGQKQIHRHREGTCGCKGGVVGEGVEWEVGVSGYKRVDDKVTLYSTTLMVYESWTIKKAEHQRTDAFELVLEKTLEASLGSKELKTVNPKRSQLWILVGRTNADAKAPILWPPDAKSQLIRKGLGAGKD